MKRIFALILALMLVLSFAACDTNTGSSKTPTAGNSDVTTDPADAAGEDEEFVFSEVSIYESDMFSIMVSSIDAENPSGYALNVKFSNNTEAEETVVVEPVYELNGEGELEHVDDVEYTEEISTTLEFVLTSAKINGSEIALSFSTDADSGARLIDQIVFDAAVIEELGDPTEIELTFRVYDSAKPDVDIAVVTGTVYPYGAPSADAE